MRMKFFIAVLALAWMLTGCEQASRDDEESEGDTSAQELENFLGLVKSRLVFVEGGEFLMGDFGEEYGPDKLRYDLQKDSKPLHKVKLSGYSIGQFKVTNQEYQFFLKQNGLQLREVEEYQREDWHDINSNPANPAHVDWYEAEKYCNWLAKVTRLPFHLPTEAQWEYAARSRGQFLPVATDDGTYKTTVAAYSEHDGPRGINISNWVDRKRFALQMGWGTGSSTPLPVDRYPPNPLGLYGMSDNGFEWVKDWYDPNYYQNSPPLDPQGPEAPVFIGPASNHKYAKVLRGVDYADPQWGAAVNVQRIYRAPDGTMGSLHPGKDAVVIYNKTARCVVNSTEQVR